MPELPEVETVLRTFETKIKDKKILDIAVLYAPIVEGDVADFKNKLIGQHFRDFKRRGKYLLFEMDDITLVSHLRMEGKYFYVEDGYKYDKHTHIIFKLDDGHLLLYHDVRKFGRMELIPKTGDYSIFKKLGPEPFDERFNLSYCKNYLSKKQNPIKEILLDQSFVAGIGNIYDDEILFGIGVSPFKKGCELSDTDIINLINETRKVLGEAIKCGGTTIRSYTSSLGVTGRFQQSLRCHTMKTCPKCGGDIKKVKLKGRGTYYCPNCQK